MKKVTALLMLFLFLITNSGMAVTIHWCGDRLASINFFSADKHHCPCSRKAMKHGCCKDKTTTFKANDELANSTSCELHITAPGFGFALVSQIEALNLPAFKYSDSDFYHPPPFKPDVPIYLLNGAFLI